VEKYEFKFKGRINMIKQYAIFKTTGEKTEIIKMSTSKGELIDYRNSFPEEERKNLILAERFISGPKEHQKGFWQPELFA
jgi:hypothetical protein